MEEFGRTTMADRYESWRSSSRAPGPSVAITPNATTLELRETFFAGQDLTLNVAPTDFFPVEAHDDWERAARLIEEGAGELAGRYFAELPRGRSMRLFVRDTRGVPLWDAVFNQPIEHRHTVMDTQWRFVNHVLETNENAWYNDTAGVFEPIRPISTIQNATPPPSLGPSTSVREEFFADFDRRIDLLGPTNAVAQRLQDFYQVYPSYWGPSVEPAFQRGVPWR